MPKILVSDGNRHMLATGYGQLCRSIILSLKRHSRYSVVVQKRTSEWDDVPHKEELLSISDDVNDYDLNLIVGAPSHFTKKRLTFCYTQNALSDLRSEWIDWLKEADGIIVPGKFDEDVFKKYFTNVHICHQYVDSTIFKSISRYRSEGPLTPSFLFVGSFGYRKGVDLLFDFFSKAFVGDRKVSLSIHSFTGLENQGINYLLKYSALLNKNVNLNVFNGALSPAWMNRIYNRHDVIVSLSRGEGWCMPLHEALMCGKPVIASKSTAMDEFLPSFGVRRVDVKEKLVDDILDPFGLGMKKHYGNQGIGFWEPLEEDAIRAFCELRDDLSSYTEDAKKAREFLIGKYSLESMAEQLSRAFKSVGL